MDSKRMSHFGDKEIQCPCCHKESRYMVSSNSSHCQIQCNHCYDQFLACPDSDCNYCVVNNKRARSYMNRHQSSKKKNMTTTYSYNNPLTDDSTFQHQRIKCTLCNVSFHHRTSPRMKNKLEIDCPNCHETLFCCKICCFATHSTSHGEKKFRKHQCIHTTKEPFHNIDSNSTYKHLIEPESKQCATPKQSTVLNSSTTSNEFTQDHEDSNNIHFDSSDGAIVDNLNNNTTRCQRHEYGEVNLQQKDFYYLSYQHNTTNGNATCIFNSNNSGWKFFWQNHLLMSNEGKLIGGLCGLFHRSVYQDFDSMDMIPMSGTILILQLLDVLLDVTKKRQIGLMNLISQIFNTFVKPQSVNPNVSFHFPTTMKEADALLLSGSK